MSLLFWSFIFVNTDLKLIIFEVDLALAMPEQFRVLVCKEVVELKTSVHFFLLGEKDIPGLTDTTVPRRLGPKRASRIRKLFNLSKEDDVRQYVVRKPLNKDGMRDYAI